MSTISASKITTNKKTATKFNLIVIQRQTTQGSSRSTTFIRKGRTAANINTSSSPCFKNHQGIPIVIILCSCFPRIIQRICIRSKSRDCHGQYKAEFCHYVLSKPHNKLLISRVYNTPL